MYGIFDIRLDSDFPLPELSSVDRQGQVIKTSLLSFAEAVALKEKYSDSVDWYHELKDRSGQLQINCGRIDKEFVLEFPNLAYFLISEHGGSIRCFPLSGVIDETLRHMLLDQVVPRLLGQQGRLILHASAVIVPGGKSIAFLGHSGWGKSTIASYFHEKGASLLTDDCLLLATEKDKVFGIPYYYGMRLYPDSAEAIFPAVVASSSVASYTEKNRYLLQNPHQQNSLHSAPLGAIFLLADPGSPQPATGVHIKSVKGARELVSLIEQLFLLDPTDKSLITQQFNNVGTLASSSTPIYRLTYPRDHDLLDDIYDAVMNAVIREH